MKLLILSFSLAISLIVYAKKEEMPFKTIGGKLPFKLKVIKDKKDYLDTITIYKNNSKKPHFTYKAPLLGNVLLEVAALKFKKRNILLTRWTRGAHSQKLLLIDLDKSNKEAIFQHISSWPFFYKIKNNQLIIKTSTYKKGKNISEIKTWTP